MVITNVQDYIAAGQFRGGEQLLDASAAKPGTILAFLEPLEKDGLADVTAGSSCIVNAYTSNHGTKITPRGGRLRPWMSTRVRISPRREMTRTSPP